MNKNPTMKELLIEWRKLLKEEYDESLGYDRSDNDRDLTEDERDLLVFELQQMFGSTVFFGQPEVYITPNGRSVAVDDMSIGFIDTDENQTGSGPGGEYYPPFLNPPPATYGENEDLSDDVYDWVMSQWVSEHALQDLQVTAYDYTPDLGNGFVNVNIVIDRSILVEK